MRFLLRLFRPLALLANRIEAGTQRLGIGIGGDEAGLRVVFRRFEHDEADARRRNRPAPRFLGQRLYPDCVAHRGEVLACPQRARAGKSRHRRRWGRHPAIADGHGPAARQRADDPVQSVRRRQRAHRDGLAIRPGDARQGRRAHQRFEGRTVVRRIEIDDRSAAGTGLRLQPRAVRFLPGSDREQAAFRARKAFARLQGCAPVREQDAGAAPFGQQCVQPCISGAAGVAHRTQPSFQIARGDVGRAHRATVELHQPHAFDIHAASQRVCQLRLALQRVVQPRYGAIPHDGKRPAAALAAPGFADEFEEAPLPRVLADRHAGTHRRRHDDTGVESALPPGTPSAALSSPVEPARGRRFAPLDRNAPLVDIGGVQRQAIVPIRLQRTGEPDADGAAVAREDGIDAAFETVGKVDFAQPRIDALDHPPLERFARPVAWLQHPVDHVAADIESVTGHHAALGQVDGELAFEYLVGRVVEPHGHFGQRDRPVQPDLDIQPADIQRLALIADYAIDARGQFG